MKGMYWIVNGRANTEHPNPCIITNFVCSDSTICEQSTYDPAQKGVITIGLGVSAFRSMAMPRTRRTTNPTDCLVLFSLDIASYLMSQRSNMKKDPSGTSSALALLF